MDLISADYWNLQEDKEYLGVSLQEKSNMNASHTPTIVNNYNTFFICINPADESMAGEPEKPGFV